MRPNESWRRWSISAATPRMACHTGEVAMYEAPLEAFKDVPKAESCRLMDVDRVAIITRESSPPQEILAVSGTTPSRTMAVDRVPRVYLQPPDSWGIAGIGVCLELVSQRQRLTPRVSGSAA